MSFTNATAIRNILSEYDSKVSATNASILEHSAAPLSQKLRLLAEVAYAKKVIQTLRQILANDIFDAAEINASLENRLLSAVTELHAPMIGKAFDVLNASPNLGSDCCKTVVACLLGEERSKIFNEWIRVFHPKVTHQLELTTQKGCSGDIQFSFTKTASAKQDDPDVCEGQAHPLKHIIICGTVYYNISGLKKFLKKSKWLPSLLTTFENEQPELSEKLSQYIPDLSKMKQYLEISRNQITLKQAIMRLAKTFKECSVKRTGNSDVLYTALLLLCRRALLRFEAYLDLIPFDKKTDGADTLKLALKTTSGKTLQSVFDRLDDPNDYNCVEIASNMLSNIMNSPENQPYLSRTPNLTEEGLSEKISNIPPKLLREWEDTLSAAGTVSTEISFADIPFEVLKAFCFAHQYWLQAGELSNFANVVSMIQDDDLLTRLFIQDGMVFSELIDMDTLKLLLLHFESPEAKARLVSLLLKDSRFVFSGVERKEFIQFLAPLLKNVCDERRAAILSLLVERKYIKTWVEFFYFMFQSVDNFFDEFNHEDYDYLYKHYQSYFGDNILKFLSELLCVIQCFRRFVFRDCSSIFKFFNDRYNLQFDRLSDVERIQYAFPALDKACLEVILSKLTRRTLHAYFQTSRKDVYGRDVVLIASLKWTFGNDYQVVALLYFLLQTAGQHLSVKSVLKEDVLEALTKHQASLERYRQSQKTTEGIVSALMHVNLLSAVQQWVEHWHRFADTRYQAVSISFNNPDALRKSLSELNKKLPRDMLFYYKVSDLFMCFLLWGLIGGIIGIISYILLMTDFLVSISGPGASSGSVKITDVVSSFELFCQVLLGFLFVSFVSLMFAGVGATIFSIHWLPKAWRQFREGQSQFEAERTSLEADMAQHLSHSIQVTGDVETVSVDPRIAEVDPVLLEAGDAAPSVPVTAESMQSMLVDNIYALFNSATNRAVTLSQQLGPINFGRFIRTSSPQPEIPDEQTPLLGHQPSFQR